MSDYELWIVDIEYRIQNDRGNKLNLFLTRRNQSLWYKGRVAYLQTLHIFKNLSSIHNSTFNIQHSK
jgi:hypothetical protein